MNGQVQFFHRPVAIHLLTSKRRGGVLYKGSCLSFGTGEFSCHYTCAALSSKRSLLRLPEVCQDVRLYPENGPVLGYAV